MKRVAMLSYTFVMMNWAAVAGLCQYLAHPKGTNKTVWSGDKARVREPLGNSAGEGIKS
jgi:hypothetical protein